MDNVILATLAYAHASGTPLTALQVLRRMLAPARVGGTEILSPSRVLLALDGLTARGRVREYDGWYLPGRPAGAPAGTDSDFFIRRLDEANINAQKWKRMLRKARWLQAVPFVRALAASGSLAVGTTDADSDWDMFVIAKRERLYTTRLLLVIAAKFLGTLRTKGERVAPDKFCFNHYVTDDGLNLRHRSLYVAYAVACLMPVYDPDGMLSRLWQSNRWVSDYLASWPPPETATVRRAVHRSRTLAVVRRIGQVLLAGPPGNGLEAILRHWQQRRIAREPATNARGGRVIADDRELEFHPHSAERAVLVRYNRAMAALGMPVHEQDSGLR